MDILDSAFRSSTPLPSAPPTPAEGPSPRASTSTIRPAVVTAAEVNLNDSPQPDAQPKEAAGTAAAAATAAVGEAKKGIAGLEEEVGQVVSQLSSWGGSFWGGVKKQSFSALTTLQKETSRTVQQAQSELQKLSTTSVSVDLKDPLDFASLAVSGGPTPAAAAPADATATAKEKDVTADGEKLDKGKSKAVEGEDASASEPVDPTASPPTSPKPPQTAQQILSRLSSQLPPSLSLSQLQKSLADTQKSLQSNPALDITALRASVEKSIKENLDAGRGGLKEAEKLAGGYLKKSEALAGGYLKKSEELLAEARGKGEVFLVDAGEFLKDAVKVVPPTGEDGGAPGYQSWDGTGDIYHFSTSSSSSAPTAPTVLFDRATASKNLPRPSSDTHRALRKSALLRRLRSDKELLLVDPSSESETPARREAFRNFVETEIEGRGGWEGTEVEGLVWGEMGPEAEGTEGLKAMRDSLVPSQLTKEVFWTRYLFHKHSIELEEEKRKKLLEVTQQPSTEDDFSWDADEEEGSTPRLASPAVPSAPTPKRLVPTPTPRPVATTPTPAAPTGLGVALPPATSPERKSSVVAARAVGDSASTSPRESEESYDIVSDPGVGGPVAGMTPSPSPVVVRKVDAVAEAKKQEEEEEDEDSDWE